MIDFFELKALSNLGRLALTKCLRANNPRKGLRVVVHSKEPFIIRCYPGGRLKKVVGVKDVYGFIPFLLGGLRCSENRDYVLRVVEVRG